MTAWGQKRRINVARVARHRQRMSSSVKCCCGAGRKAQARQVDHVADCKAFDYKTGWNRCAADLQRAAVCKVDRPHGRARVKHQHTAVDRRADGGATGHHMFDTSVVDGRVTGCAACFNDLQAAEIDRGAARRAAGEDVLKRAVVDRGAARRAAGPDDLDPAAIERGAVRRAEHVLYPAEIDRGAARRATGADDLGPAEVERGAVRDAAAFDELAPAEIDRGAVRRAALKTAQTKWTCRFSFSSKYLLT